MMVRVGLAIVLVAVIAALAGPVSRRTTPRRRNSRGGSKRPAGRTRSASTNSAAIFSPA